MRPRSTARLGLALSLLVLTLLPAAAADERLTFDWIFSDEGKSAASMPDHAWLDNGKALIYDHQPAPEKRTLEWVDPGSGKRSRAVDAAKALESLNAILEPEEPIDELGWPDAINPRGDQVVYERSDRACLLTLDSAEFTCIGARDEELQAARFSPDGKQLAFVRDHDLYLVDLDSGEERRLTTDGTETLLNGTVSWVYWEEIFGRNDLGYHWSPDSKRLAYLQTDESGVGLMHFPHFKPNIPELITQRYPKAGEANPRVRAGVIDLESGETTWIDLGAHLHEYLVRVDWMPNSERLAVQTLDRPQTKLDLFWVDAATGAATHVLRETDPAWINVHDDLHFLPSRDQFLWRSERDGYPHLYVYGMDGKLVRQLTRGEWSLRNSGGVFWKEQAVAHVDDKGGAVWFTGLEKSSIERHLYRIDLEGKKMQRLTPEDGTHRILFAPDGKRFFDLHSAIDTMPTLTLRDRNGGIDATVGRSRADVLKRFDLLQPELFSIDTEDGFAMPARLIRPRDFDPKTKYPVVFYVYGGPAAPSVSHSWGGRARDYYHQMLADAGFAVMLVDNRSATAISKPLEATVLHQAGGEGELNDLLDAVQWLKGQSWVDPDRVGIWGWSGGGTFTLNAMTSSKEFHAGVAVAAVTDWRYYDTKWAEKFMKRPQDNPEGYAKTSHADRAKELSGRLLLVHGSYDDNVHPQNTWDFADELIEAGITFDMMIYPMRKHGIRDDEAQAHLYKTMLEFWQENARRTAD